MNLTRGALVTGASGFIGRPLCHALTENNLRVTAIARRQCAGPWHTLHICDLAADPVPDACFDGIDTVFHLASRVHQSDEFDGDDDAYHRINVEGTRKLLTEAAKRNVSRFIFFSSVKAADEGSDVLVDEDSTPQPQSVYGRTKLEAENLVLKAAENSGMSATVLRLPLVYGPGVKGNLREMIDTVGRGRFPPIAECGNRRAMIHVNDVVNAALLAAGSESANGKMYYVTDEREYSTRQIYDTIRRGLGKAPATWSVPILVFRIAALLGDVTQKAGIRMPIDSSRLQKLIGSARYDGSRIRRELGFHSRETFDSSISDMIAAMGSAAMDERKGACS